MNKIASFVVLLFITSLVSCKKDKSEWTGFTISYKESKTQKRIYFMDSLQSTSRNLKSFEDADRQL